MSPNTSEDDKMKMTQQEWKTRVELIGELAGWNPLDTEQIAKNRPGLQWIGIMARNTDEIGAPEAKFLAAHADIRQLAADWLASEGVVAQA